ncbi:MAG TPA: hypothetical protein DIW47_15190 [Bacteroidetes bacterium]|nr:hypothetical protein [Bacteroidota bacterium]
MNAAAKFLPKLFCQS